MAIVSLEKTKVFLQIKNNDKDELINALIPQVEADYLLIRNYPFNIDSNDEINYPDDAELTAAQMIGFLISDIAKSGFAMNSERIGDYSYTGISSADMIAGYPRNIISKIKKYVNSKS